MSVLTLINLWVAIPSIVLIGIGAVCLLTRIFRKRNINNRATRSDSPISSVYTTKSSYATSNIHEDWGQDNDEHSLNFSYTVFKMESFSLGTRSRSHSESSQQSSRSCYARSLSSQKNSTVHLRKKPSPLISPSRFRVSSSQNNPTVESPPPTTGLFSQPSTFSRNNSQCPNDYRNQNNSSPFTGSNYSTYFHERNNAQDFNRSQCSTNYEKHNSTLFTNSQSYSNTSMFTPYSDPSVFSPCSSNLTRRPLITQFGVLPYSMTSAFNVQKTAEMNQSKSRLFHRNDSFTALRDSYQESDEDITDSESDSESDSTSDSEDDSLSNFTSVSQQQKDITQTTLPRKSTKRHRLFPWLLAFLSISVLMVVLPDVNWSDFKIFF